MKRSMKEILKRRHPISEYFLVCLMAVVLLLAAIVINISNFFMNKLLPFILLKIFRKTTSGNHDINTNTL